MSIQTQLNRINSEVSAQAADLATLKTALEGKAGIVSTPKTCTLNFSFVAGSNDLNYSTAMRHGAFFFHVEDGVSVPRFIGFLGYNYYDKKPGIPKVYSSDYSTSGYYAATFKNVECGTLFGMFTNLNSAFSSTDGSVFSSSKCDIEQYPRYAMGSNAGNDGTFGYFFKVPDLPGETIDITYNNCD